MDKKNQNFTLIFLFTFMLRSHFHDQRHDRNRGIYREYPQHLLWLRNKNLNVLVRTLD